MLPNPLVQLNPVANPAKELLVRNDCDGTPNCVVEIRMRDGDRVRDWMEVHLNVEEAMHIRDAITRALVDHVGGGHG